MKHLFLINNIAKKEEVYVLPTYLSRNKNISEICIRILNAKNMPTEYITFLINYLRFSKLKVTVESFGNINFNELLLMAAANTCDRVMANYSSVKMDSSTPIAEPDFLKGSRLIADHTDYPFINVLNDFENKVTLDADKIVKYGIVNKVEKFHKPIKSNSTWTSVFSEIKEGILN